MSKDYYQILGVAKIASADEIKVAFRRLAHVYHPDKLGGDETKFKEISGAYQILSNPAKRKQYDQSGPSAFVNQGFAGTHKSWEEIKEQGGNNYDNIIEDLLDGTLEIVDDLIHKVI